MSAAAVCWLAYSNRQMGNSGFTGVCKISIVGNTGSVGRVSRVGVLSTSGGIGTVGGLSITGHRGQIGRVAETDYGQVGAVGSGER